jgi:poly(ADP-ribose) glycohydrolase ARH3
MRLEQIEGCLLGKAVADSIGATFEGQGTEWLRGRFDNKRKMFRYSADAPRLYTDATEMALALADYLAEHPRIATIDLMRTFLQHYNPGRGYGRGVHVLMDAFGSDGDYEHLVNHLFPGGSWGNGGAMRAAPVGLRFSNDSELLWEQARQSAWPTHRNALCIEGAQLMALATAVAATCETITPAALAELLLTRATTGVFRKQLTRLRDVSDESELVEFGNGIEAHASVVTALGCFALFPDDFEGAVSTAIWQGGDTDTIAAMTGALVGARLGVDCIEEHWVAKLEDEAFPGRVKELSRRLLEAMKE